MGVDHILTSRGRSGHSFKLLEALPKEGKKKKPAGTRRGLWRTRKDIITCLSSVYENRPPVRQEDDVTVS